MAEIAVTGVPVRVDVRRSNGVGARLLRRAVREPFLHFLFLGAVLFAVNEYLEERSKFTRIVITPEVVQGIATNYALQYGAKPTGAQLESLVDEYVREEVFYHAALKLGLDRDDEIIRRRLVQKYEFLQQDLALAREPGLEELRAYYNEHMQEYRTPERVTFTQVYFSPDLRGEEGARADALRVAMQLRERGVSRAVEEGDRFAGPTDYATASAEELSRVFGKEGLAQEVFSLPLNHWSEPIHSGLGWHLLFVSEHRPPELNSFERAEDTVRRDYFEAVRARRNAEVYARLKRGFVVVRE
jgi:peptidyl-prolyl cis-trans isomerase C